MAQTPKSLEDSLHNVVFSTDSLEAQLRMVIAFARDEGNLPKDRYVQVLEKIIRQQQLEMLSRLERRIVNGLDDAPYIEVKGGFFILYEEAEGHVISAIESERSRLLKKKEEL